jgi:transcription termination/antitermination protein NusG
MDNTYTQPDTSKTHSFNDDVPLSDLKPRWYIVQTYVGFEDAVYRNLELKINNLPSIAVKILEIFIPTKKVIKLDKNGARKEVVEKIYPGYIYMNMILDRETGYVIQNTQYVSRIAGTGDYAVPLDAGYVEKLKQQLHEESQQLKAGTKVVYRVGDLVEVIDGPFKDMRGKVSGLDLQNSRIMVLLSIFDRETSVELDILQIKKIL